MLRRVLSLVAVCSSLAPVQALAWQAPAGSPPGWRQQWILTMQDVVVYAHASGSVSFGQLPAGMYFRVDAPPQNDRFWVYDPLTNGWAWIPTLATQPTPEPTTEQVAQTARNLDPRTYLYAAAPDLAPRLDCIIMGESGWDPSQQNASSYAAGLAQFIPSTWLATPQGKQGLSPFEPAANIDAAIWLARTRGWSQWQVVLDGLCP